MKTSAQFAVVAVLTFVTVVVAMGATAGEDQRSNTQLNQIVRTLKTAERESSRFSLK